MKLSNLTPVQYHVRLLLSIDAALDGLSSDELPVEVEGRMLKLRISRSNHHFELKRRDVVAVLTAERDRLHAVLVELGVEVDS